jgi:hypothetical protein
VFAEIIAMKVKSLLAILLMMCTACMVRGQKNNSAVVKIEFTTLTRGYQKQVFISADSLIKIVEGRSNENSVVKRKLEDGEWAEIEKQVSGINLAEIAALKSPSSRRAFDGARHSTIVISTNDGKSYTHSFDDESPNEKFHGLMELIKKMDGDSQSTDR